MSEQSARLLQVILASKLTYIELEKKTGIAKSSIQRYATGRTRKIPIDAVKLIADATNSSAAWIMGWDESVHQTEEKDVMQMSAQELLDYAEKMNETTYDILGYDGKNRTRTKLTKEEYEKVMSIIEILRKESQ